MLKTFERTAAIGTALIIIVVGVAWAMPVDKRLGAGSAPEGAARHRIVAHPVAALAWAQANCDSRLMLRPGTPRTQSEILYEVAAAFDAGRTWRSLGDICKAALAASRDVSVIVDQNVQAPASPRYDTAANSRAK